MDYEYEHRSSDIAAYKGFLWIMSMSTDQVTLLNSVHIVYTCMQENVKRDSS